jgi:hypothetical protein
MTGDWGEPTTAPLSPALPHHLRIFRRAAEMANTMTSAVTPDQLASAIQSSAQATPSISASEHSLYTVARTYFDLRCRFVLLPPCPLSASCRFSLGESCLVSIPILSVCATIPLGCAC